MTDKEMLLLAAKAIGLPERYVNSAWNPLEDDGDRYRLAKKLGMQVNFELQYVKFYAAAGGYESVISWPNDAADDAYATVMAAAVIGASL